MSNGTDNKQVFNYVKNSDGAPIDWGTPDYTGASAGRYVNKYTNRPEDAGTLEGLQNILSVIGIVADPADYINSAIYASQGDAKNAALYGSGLGILGGLKLFRGIPRWYRGQVRGGKWYGGQLTQEVGSTPSGHVKEGIFATPDKKYAEEYLQTHEPGSKLLEFDIPDEAIKDLYKSDVDETFGFIEGGIPKEYLTKVHTPRYSQYDRKWYYGKSDDVIDELK
jgi:hypothetical protein